MKNFEAPDMNLTVLSGISIIGTSTNEFALIERIPSIEQAANQDENQ